MASRPAVLQPDPRGGDNYRNLPTKSTLLSVTFSVQPLADHGIHPKRPKVFNQRVGLREQTLRWRLTAFCEHSWPPGVGGGFVDRPAVGKGDTGNGQRASARIICRGGAMGPAAGDARGYSVRGHRRTERACRATRPRSLLGGSDDADVTISTGTFVAGLVLAFTSEHGDMIGDHGMVQKMNMYEESRGCRC